MSIGHTEMSNGPLDEKKCPLNIKMSICLLDEQKRPLDVRMSIGRTEMSSGHSNVHWTYCRGIGHVCIPFIACMCDCRLIQSDWLTDF